MTSFDLLSADDEEMDPSDEKMKKKQQNSVRWKRWWLKNREAYNEKRRLSAQLRSAKNRVNKEKSAAVPASSTKRMRKTQEVLPNSAVVVEQTFSVTQETMNMPPTISPAHVIRSMVPQLQMLTSASFAVGAAPSQQQQYQQHPLLMPSPQLNIPDMMGGLRMGQFYPSFHAPQLQFMYPGMTPPRPMESFLRIPSTSIFNSN